MKSCRECGAQGRALCFVCMGRIGGRRNVELHGCPATLEGRAKGGRTVVVSGQIAENGLGIPCVTEDGNLVKSINEAIFYAIALAFGGEPRYEPCVIDNYTPDFILGKSILGLPKNVPIELKPHRNWRKIHDNRQRIPPSVLIIYANELWTRGRF